jgi:hypothetical protein
MGGETFEPRILTVLKLDKGDKMSTVTMTPKEKKLSRLFELHNGALKASVRALEGHRQKIGIRCVDEAESVFGQIKRLLQEDERPPSVDAEINRLCKEQGKFTRTLENAIQLASSRDAQVVLDWLLEGNSKLADLI